MRAILLAGGLALIFTPTFATGLNPGRHGVRSSSG